MSKEFFKHVLPLLYLIYPGACLAIHIINPYSKTLSSQALLSINQHNYYDAFQMSVNYSTAQLKLDQAHVQ